MTIYIYIFIGFPYGYLAAGEYDVVARLDMASKYIHIYIFICTQSYNIL